MSWRASNGREPCNACRRIPPQGEDVYRGELTPAIWCKGCAAERGYGGTGEPVEHLKVMAGLDKRQLAARFPEFTEAMRRLRDVARAKTLRGDRSAQIAGERRE